MPSKRGISILDLIGVLPAGSQTLIPADIEAQLEKLTVLEYRSTTTDDVHIHYGTVQSIADAWLPSLRNWPVDLPLINVGVPFQMVRARMPKGSNTLEPAASSFFIDLFLNRIAITIPGLKPAKLVAGDGQTVAHLVPDPDRDKVRIVGGGTLRLSFPATGGPQVLFVSPTDGLDPHAPTGAVFDLSFDPPQFFIGGSDIGLRVDRLTYDDSVDFTPPEIIARQQGDEWRGISIREATVFLPRNARWIGDLNVGVRDVLLGSPMGLQGEIQIEFGRTPVNPSGLQFFQAKPNGEIPIGVPAPTGDNRATVLNIISTGNGARMRAVAPPDNNSTFFWTLPDGTNHLGDDVDFFDVHDQDALRVRSIEKGADETAAVSPESAIWFSVKPPSPDLVSPLINVNIPGVQFQGKPVLENVAFASGTADALNTLSFSTSFSADDAADLQWKVGVGGSGGFGVGPDFKPDLPDYAGPYDLVVSRPAGLVRRARIEVLPEGGLLLGAESGVYHIVGTAVVPISLQGVESTFRGFDFHPTGAQLAATSVATIDANHKVVTEDGTIAVVTAQLGTKDDPDTPAPTIPPPDPIKELHVLMNFGTTEEYNWGEKRLAEPFSIEALRKWAFGFPGGDFHVTGRTCNIGTTERNTALASQCAERGKQLLCDPNLPGPQTNPDVVTAVGEAPDPATGKILIDIENPDLTGDNRYRSPRPAYRRIEIKANGQPLNVPVIPNIEAQLDPVLRRAFVPGKDTAVVFVPNNREPTRPYRVRLVVRWDSPTVASLSDAIPTLAELLVAWQKEQVQLPGLPANGPDTKVTPDGPEVFTLVGRWTYDSRSGETMFSLSFSNAGSPDGLFSITNNTAATAFALGPALISGLSAMDAGTKAVHIAALLGACVAAAKSATNGKVVFYGITVEEKQRAINSLAGSQQHLLFDYTAQVGFNIDAGGLKITADKPLKVRYKNAGIEIDNSKSGFDRFGIVYDQCSFDIEDPGQWTISGPLGQLLRVTGTRAGSGSTWMEVDLAFCLDLDTVKVTNATVRVNFPTGSNPLGIELRGLGAEVNIPGAIKGGGRLLIGSGGEIKAGLDIDIIPANIKARGGLALKGAMCNLELALLLPVGIPLGSSGLGLYGFLGRFVSNGKRLLGSDQDPVNREIAWYRTPPENKYDEARGQWALGLGAVIGTLPDTAFTFNALGMLTIAFPDPEVVFSLDAKMIQKPSLPKEQGDAAVAGLELLGIMVFGPDAFILGIRGAYTIPKLLKLAVPINGFFPFDHNKSSYLRIGSDGVNNRKGDPISCTIFPGIIDLKAWAYLMIEERELLDLGNQKNLDLHGFSIGFGAGWAVNWSAGPIKLSASAEVYVGLGTKPFTLVGLVGVRGELSLVIISISAAADITAHIQNIPKTNDFFWELDGDIRAKVDLFFFSIEGHVHFHLDAGQKPDPIPVPDHPLARVELTDRNGVITGRALGGSESASGLPSTVWPDTIPLLHFSHFIQNRLNASAFAPKPDVLPGPEWSGTSELKYAYRLKDVRIVKKGSTDTVLSGPLDSVWWWPTHRGGVLDPNDPAPSEHESRMLALLSWNPVPWSRNLTNGGAGTPGDPKKTVENVCKPALVPVRNCANAVHFIRTGVDSIQFAPSGKGSPPIPSFFTCFGKETGNGKQLATYQASLAVAGQRLEPGKSLSFSIPTVIPIESQLLPGGYELGYAASQTKFIKTTQFEATLGPNLVDPALTLAVWDNRDKLICDFFADIHSGGPGPIFPRDGVLYQRSGAWSNDLGETQLFITNPGFVIQFPGPVNFVTLTLMSGAAFGNIQINARNSAGAIVFSKPVSGSRNGEPFNITLSDLAITRVELSSLQIPKLVPGNPVPISGTPSLLAVCWATASSLTPPQVTGVRSDSSTSAWTPQNVGTVAIPGALGPAKIIRYTSPQGGSWNSVRVNEYSGGHVAILTLSGVTWIADHLAKDNETTKQQIKDDLNDKASKDAAEKRTLLEANSAYEVQVDCQWRGWRKTKDAPEPPPLDDSGWQNLPTAVYSFQTAAEAVLGPQPPPADFKDETHFDPRGVARYIIGVRPDVNAAPHFLDDSIQVDFSVDHLEPLLQKYGRKLILKLRRTDPGVNALPRFGKPPDQRITVTPTALAHNLKSIPDQYLFDCFAGAPCVQAPDTGGQSLEIQANLEPNAEYDLLLVAVPVGNQNSDDVLVFRSHFQTSRYRNPGEMLKALGFSTSQPNPVLPHDAILDGTSAVTLTPSLANDQDFEEALQTLKLDPWPLSPDPRTVLLWTNNAQSYQLSAVMLEHNEPMVRPGRMDLGGVNLVAGAQAKQPLTLARTNAAGTRALLIPGAPLTVGADAVLETGFKDNNNIANARRFVHTTPRMVYEEVL